MDRVAVVRELGVEVGFETKWVGEPGNGRHEVELPHKVRGITLPFSAEDWVSIAQCEGQYYVGGCCANMSVLQDEVNGVFRDGGYADGATLLKIGEAARGHEGFEDFAPVDDEGFEKLVERWRRSIAYLEEHSNEKLQIDPWFKLAVAFNAVESKLSADSQVAPRERYPWENEEHVIVRQLANATYRMDWHDLFRGAPRRGGGVDDEEADEKDQHEALRRVYQARVLPLAEKVAKLLAELEWPFEGFAVVKEGTDEVMGDHRGPCIYADRESAERTLERWAEYARKEAERHKKWKEEGRDSEERANFWINRKTEMVPVRIAPGEGVVVLRD